MEKIARLLHRVEKMVTLMEANADLHVHRTVSQFYYMQKAEELRIWHAQLEELQQRISSLAETADEEYSRIYCRWRKDVRWLSAVVGKERPDTSSH